MTPNHRHHRRHSGMTLVELMVVVAIIVLLGSIMAYFITGSRSQNAQKNMTNDILALINDQRARAIGLNVAAYITFSPTTVQPRLGKTSACTTVATDQLPIRYTSGSVDVAIDFGDVGNKSHRTLDSVSTEKYYRDGHGLVTLDYRISDTLAKKDGLLDDSASMTICFQPNGFVYFMKGDAFVDKRYAAVDIAPVNADFSNRITVSALGAISRLSCATRDGQCI
mgnify:CR=1 FL=1